MTIPAGYVPSSQGWYYDLDSGAGPFWLDSDGTMQRVSFPSKFFTDDDGPYARLRVDTGQTGFFAGRECYTFYEFSIATGASEYIQITAPVDTIVQMFGANISSAALKISLFAGGTPAGTFGTALPVFRTNTMSSALAYTPVVTMVRGGTHSGGTLAEVISMVAGSNPANFTEHTVTADRPRGFPAGTYYVKLENIDGATCTGIFRAQWEERS